MYGTHRVGVIIPVLNEEANIASVVRGIPKFVDIVVVVDNGSTDRTKERAEANGALVLGSKRGYGSACLTGIEYLRGKVDTIVFVSGDNSDVPEEMASLLDPIVERGFDLVIGSRTIGSVEPRAMTLCQRLGNRLATRLMDIFWGAGMTDLGPYRAITMRALEQLNMQDQDYGWTVEMQLKAIKLGLKYTEVPVRYRARQHGAPKVAGTVRGTVLSGYKILGWIFWEALLSVWALRRGWLLFFLCSFWLFSAPKSIFANNIALISASELLNDGARDYILIDARPMNEYKKGHIPGAIPFSWEDYTEVDPDGVKYRIWPPERLAKALKRLGIQEDANLVVYGDGDKSWGGEAWVLWMFSWLGHKGKMYLLNGGIQSWLGENSPIEKGPFIPKRPPVKAYHVELNPRINITAQELAHLKDVNIVDVRSTMEWFFGHIPRAVHIPWTLFSKGSNHSMINQKELKELFYKYHLDPDKKTIYYCTGGVRSAWAWLAHTLARTGEAVNFEGGIEEWNKTEKR